MVLRTRLYRVLDLRGIWRAVSEVGPDGVNTLTLTPGCVTVSHSTPLCFSFFICEAAITILGPLWRFCECQITPTCEASGAVPRA